jgi:hypothetical protein
VHSAFYEPAGAGIFVATPATAGPWSAHAQHGGPPSALVAREFDRLEPDEGQRLARVTVDILRPVPLGQVTVRTRIVRPGRRVALLEAVLEAEGREVLHARGWRIAIADGGVPAVTASGTQSAPMPDGAQLATLPDSARPAMLPDGAQPAMAPDGRALPAIPAEQPPPSFRHAHTDGYLSAIDWRFLRGGFDDYGPGAAWTRPRIPLVAGEEASPMCRALLVADSGSGVGAALDPAKFMFINVDLTVVLPRDPAGEWLLLESATTIGKHGAGLAETTLSDEQGNCGRALQTLLVERR